MKKIFISLLAVAALAACTKSEVAYEAPGEIGFNVVGGNITKAVVDGTIYPTALNMYVFAHTTTSDAADADYIENGEFKYRDQYNNIDTESDDETKVWGGVTPYYWPNANNLHFTGYSKVTGLDLDKVTYNCSTDILSITDYTPGTDATEGANDLMWFPSTKHDKADGYDKNTDYVPVSMYHTCSWISFYVKGDKVTGGDASTYTVTDIAITGIDNNADLQCSYTTEPVIAWSQNEDVKTATLSVLNGGTKELKGTGTDGASAIMAETTDNNTVVIPQVPGKLNLTYTYKSSTGSIITETVSGLDLALESVVEDADDTDEVTRTSWEPGKHYIYTITIKANEILIAPTPVDWTDGNFNVTVE